MLQYPFLILYWHRIMGNNFDLKSSLFLTCSLLSVQFSSVALCDPMDCSTPGFPVHHQLPEFTQIHVH